MSGTNLLNEIYNFLVGQDFSIIVDLLSIVGFIITLLVFFNVRKIKNAYVFAARVPDLVKRLKKSSSTVSQQMNDFEKNLPQIKLELASIEVTLSSLRNKLNGQTRRSAKELQKSVHNYRVNDSKREELWRVYTNSRYYFF